jgi:hypothetical protein
MTDYGPIATAVGVFLAAIALYINGWRERRRKTLEACEKLVFDKELRAHLSVVVTAIKDATYEADDAPRKVGSERDSTTTIINVIETIALGVNHHMYDEEIARLYLTVYVENLLAPFFLSPTSSRLVSKKFIAEPLPELRKLFSPILPTVPPSQAEIDKISLRRP